MSKKPCILGLDVSTTASKAVCLDSTGQILGQTATEHKISHPNPLWSEQNPIDWWTAMRQSIQTLIELSSVDPKQIQAIGLTGQMHGLVLMDSDNRVLRPAILWNDGRSNAQCEMIRERIGRESLIAITGNDAFTGFTAPKLLWVRDHEPNCYAQIAKVLLPKDYIRWHLSSEYATDLAGAGGTLLLDLSKRTWSTDLLKELQIPETWLPPTYEGIQCTGTVSRTCALETGLLEGTQIFAGGGDQSTQAIGVGAVDPNTWAVTLGTSGVVFAPSIDPIIEPMGRVHAFPHAMPQTWHLMGVMLSAAGSLQWYRDTLAPQIDFEPLLIEATDIDFGSNGLYFLPYLTGERTPHADPLLRGSFIGLTSRHTRGHMTRAVLEGVSYGLKDNLNLLQQMGLPSPKRIRISGGGAQSHVWCQILADILGNPLEVVKSSEGAAVGAALLAGVGQGIWSSIHQACDTAITIQSKIYPEESANEYEDRHRNFNDLNTRLKGFYTT